MKRSRFTDSQIMNALKRAETAGLAESPWVLRRLQLLREWSYEQEQREQIFPGSP